MTNINRIGFVGLDTLGVNTTFEIKKRLSRLKYSGTSLVSLADPDANPFQFMAISREIPDNISDLFERRSFVGADKKLFKNDTDEVCAYDDEKAGIYFQSLITRLTNFAPAAYLQKKGINISTNTAAVFFVFEIDTLKDQQWFEIIKDFLSVQEQIKFKNTFHPSAFVFSHRTSSNKEDLKALEDLFYNVYLFDEESQFVLNGMNDRIDLAANFLEAAAQMDANDFMNYFQTINLGKYYSFGTASVNYPKSELIKDATANNLGDTDFGFENGLGRRFFDFFVGKFQEHNADADEDPFILGSFDPDDEEIKNLIGGSDNYPIIRDQVSNIADNLFNSDIKDKIENYLKNIEIRLNQKALMDRIDRLTSIGTYKKICIDNWHDNLFTLDLLFDKEILKRASRSAEELKNQLLREWNNEVDELFDNVKKESPHPGELIYDLGQKIIKHGKSILSKRQETKDFHDVKYKQKDVTRKDVENAICDVPRPISLFPRLILFLSLMIFFWQDFHNFIFINMLDSPKLIPAGITGVLFGSFFCVILFWFGYKKKVDRLIEYLHSYLSAQKRKKEEELLEKKKDISIEFLQDALLATRKKIAPRPKFFKQVIINGRTNFEDLAVKDGFKQFDLNDWPLNHLESYYLNRYVLFREIQKKLKELHTKNSQGTFRFFVLNPFLDEYNDKVEDLAQTFNDYSNLLSEKVFEIEGELPMWTEALNKSKNELSRMKMEKFAAYLIANCGKKIKELLETDPLYCDLTSYIDGTEYQITTKTWNVLTNISKPTFNVVLNTIPDIQIFTGTDSLFKDLHINHLISHTIDINSIIALQIQGPVKFEDIPFKTEY